MIQVLFLQDFNLEGLIGHGWSAYYETVASFKIGDKAIVYHQNGFDWIEKGGEKFSTYFLYLLENKIIRLS